MTRTEPNRAGIDTMVVVVPARNEEPVLGAALEAIRNASRRLGADVRVEVAVVPNGCVDRTSEIAHRGGAHVIGGDVANVGAARAAGAAWALGRFARSIETLWIATTDADSVVPETWLAAQLLSAARGADVFLGTVALAPADALLHPHWVAKYAADSHRARHHGHVHGANLGVRATCYRAIGGFLPMAAHEDHDLVRRLSLDGAAIDWSTEGAVITSARLSTRTPAGVGADLAGAG